MDAIGDFQILLEIGLIQLEEEVSVHHILPHEVGNFAVLVKADLFDPVCHIRDCPTGHLEKLEQNLGHHLDLKMLEPDIFLPQGF